MIKIEDGFALTVYTLVVKMEDVKKKPTFFAATFKNQQGGRKGWEFFYLDFLRLIY